MTALGATVATARPIPADRSTSLYRWNVALAILHGIQFLAMLALSLTQSPMATAPVVSSYLTFDPATSTLIPAQRALFDVPIGPLVASFFAMSAVAHAIVAWPARGWYERNLARRMNPARWIEYAFSSSVMIVVIAMLTGVGEIGTLIAIVGTNAAMNLFGWSMEAANEGRDRRRYAWRESSPRTAGPRGRHRGAGRGRHQPRLRSTGATFQTRPAKPAASWR